jgi:hypothetical protein
MAYTFNGQPTICLQPSACKEGGILYVSDTHFTFRPLKARVVHYICPHFYSEVCIWASHWSKYVPCLYLEGYHRNIEEIRYRGEFKDAKGVIRIRKSKEDWKHNDQKKKNEQRSTKHYIEN